MQKLGMEEGEAIEHPWVSKAIENAQRKVEGHNFDIRKHLLEYDDVANEQRKVIYEMRDDAMDAEDLSESIQDMRSDVIDTLLNNYIPPGSLDEAWDISGAEKALLENTGETLNMQVWLDDDNHLLEESLRERVVTELEGAYQSKEDLAGSETLRRFEKFVTLKTLDDFWKDHLASMDYLRQSVGLRGYAQKNPKQEYKREAFEMFTAMIDEYRHEVVGVLSKVQVREPEDVDEAERLAEEQRDIDVKYQHAEAENALSVSDAPTASNKDESLDQPFVRDGKKVGRNEPCWCNSGKKFKQCHGKLV
jgi:preprotein translocase subunit SecA